MTLFFVKFPEISTGNFFQLQWEDFESFLDDTELRGYWFRRTAMLWQYDYSEIRWNKKHHWAWLFTAEYGSQVASLPSPCGRCHRALFHDSWLFSCGLTAGTTGEMSRERPWCRLGARSRSDNKTSTLTSHWNSSSLRPLRFEKFSERTIKAVYNNCPSCLEMKMRWLFGSSPFFVLICKRFFQTLKVSENIEAKTFCSGCDVSPRGGKENPAGLASCRHDKGHQIKLFTLNGFFARFSWLFLVIICVCNLQADTLYMFEFVPNTAAHVRRTMLARKCWWWDCWKRAVVVRKLFNNWECTILRPLDQHFQGRC